MASYEDSANYGFDLQMKFFKERMKEKKITQKQISQIIGVNESTLVRNFKDRNMAHTTFLKICGVLKLNPYLVPKELNQDEFQRIYFN